MRALLTRAIRRAKSARYAAKMRACVCAYARVRAMRRLFYFAGARWQAEPDDGAPDVFDSDAMMFDAAESFAQLTPPQD